MAQTVLLASAGTAALVLNPVPRSTTIILTATSCSSGACQVEFSLNDPNAPGATTSYWALLSSAVSLVSSTKKDTPLSYTVLSPIAQVRITSTAWDTAGTGGSMVLQALQSVSA